MSSPVVQAQGSPTELGEEARLQLARLYVWLIGLVQEQTADAEDPASNQTPSISGSAELQKASGR
jgi:hypothetical protein